MKYLFFVAVLFTSSFLMGQNPLKKYPTRNYYFFNSRNIVFNSSFVNDEAVKKAFIDTKILSQENFEKAFKLAQISEYPDALNTIDKLQKAGNGLENKYKCYWIGRWTEFFSLEKTFRQLKLIWIPFDENSTIREDYKPKTKDGFYLIVKSVDMDSLPYSQPSMPVINSITDKFANKKLKPASKIQNIYDGVLPFYGSLVSNFYGLLKDSFNLKNEEIETISYNTSKDSWPELFNRTQYGDSATYATINKHPYYKLGTVIAPGNYMTLYWVPDNLNFTPQEKPKSALGYFFVHRGEAVVSKYIPDEKDIYYLNTAWWFKNVSSSTSYNPSTFTFSNSSGSTASSSSNNNNGFTTTTVNGVTVATGKLERTNSEMPPKVKLPSGCATKDMKERFGYVNDDDLRWGNYKKGVVIAAYNTALAPKLPHVFNVKLQKNTTYNIGIIFSTKDRKGVLSAMHLTK